MPLQNAWFDKSQLLHNTRFNGHARNRHQNHSTYLAHSEVIDVRRSFTNILIDQKTNQHKLRYLLSHPLFVQMRLATNVNKAIAWD